MELPRSFVDLYRGRPDFLAALDGEPVVSVRLNPSKRFDCLWGERVLWCDSGRYLDSRPSFTLDPIFAAGGYYVQEASSMFIEFLWRRLELPSIVTVVDLCAAPGGKSTHLQSLVGEDGVVIANEVIRNRAGILAQNITKWGAGNGIVISADVAHVGCAMAGSVDVMVADVPCSGEGMFRKDRAARDEWTLDNVALCAARARRIVSDAWDALKDGGYLIFSTCTFNRTENEDNVDWIASNLGGKIIVDSNAPQGVEVSENGYRFWPNKVRGEGFFTALIQKTADAPRSKIKQSRVKLRPIVDFVTTDLFAVEHNGVSYGYSEPMLDIVEQLKSEKVQILTAGVEIGEIIRDKLKPSHSLALYYGVDKEYFGTADLGLGDALEFLRKGSISVGLFKDGLQLVTYDGLPLGFAKRIGSRVNNLYPTSWRIATL